VRLEPVQPRQVNQEILQNPQDEWSKMARICVLAAIKKAPAGFDLWREMSADLKKSGHFRTFERGASGFLSGNVRLLSAFIREMSWFFPVLSPLEGRGTGPGGFE
jgi:hypothetical protein